LSAEKRGFLLCFEVDKPCIVEGLSLGSLVGKRIQFFLNRGRT
jgi:hypothetical protein